MTYKNSSKEEGPYLAQRSASKQGGNKKMKKSMVWVVACLVVILSSCGFEDRFEPNDDSSTATPVEVGTETELGISIKDQDWFQLGLQNSQIGTFGIEYTYLGSLGNLNLSAYNSNRDLLGDSLYNPYNLCRPPANGKDYLSVLSLSGKKDFFFQVFGAPGAVNSLQSECVPGSLQRWSGLFGRI